MSHPLERYRAPLEGKADALYEQQGDIQDLIDTKQLRTILVFDSARLAAFKEVPTSQELGLVNARHQFRAFVVNAGTDPAKVNAMAEALDRMALMPQYKRFLETEAAVPGSYIPAKNAPAFLQGELDGLKKVVDSLPFHARYIINAAELEKYVEPF